MWVLCCLALFALLAGCAPEKHSNSAMESLPNCADISAQFAVPFSTEKHYEQMVACVKNKRFAEASFHYASAGVQTWYEYLLMPGSASKERHHTQLRNQLTSLTEDEKQQFWSALYATLRDPHSRRQLCSRIATVPVDTAAVILWNKAKVGYLHCEVNAMF